MFNKNRALKFIVLYMCWLGDHTQWCTGEHAVPEIEPEPSTGKTPAH